MLSGLQNPDEAKEAMKAAEECRASVLLLILLLFIITTHCVVINTMNMKKYKHKYMTQTHDTHKTSR